MAKTERSSVAATKVLAGASGYSFKEWKGSFYPEDQKPDGMLAFYAERLPTVEINNTFYRMPKTSVLETWAATTPADSGDNRRRAWFGCVYSVPLGPDVGTGHDLVFHRAPPAAPARVPGAAPYNAIVVALEEDPALRFVGNLVETPDGAINEIDPATIQIGDPVRVVFHRVEDVVLPRWVRVLNR